jgi:cob(I)alamin adenosyltransferase
MPYQSRAMLTKENEDLKKSLHHMELYQIPQLQEKLSRAETDQTKDERIKFLEQIIQNYQALLSLQGDC